MAVLAVFGLLIFTSGCARTSGETQRQTVELKGAELDALAVQLITQNWEFAPNSVGKLMFSADIVNTSDVYVAETTIVLEAIGEDNSHSELGQAVVVDIPPKSARRFMITTALGAGGAPHDFVGSPRAIKIYR